MRLLHTQTLELSEFFGSSVPEYAILSHCWGDNEVSFQEIGSASTNVGKSRAYKKITRFCQIADARGQAWLWIDTCCIDKTSSAELSENINAMFNYYRNATECYAYLEDVDPVAENLGHSATAGSSVYASYGTGQMCASRWFTRGWTLQELLAPSSVLFFNAAFQLMETRARAANVIADITGIESTYLRVASGHQEDLSRSPVIHAASVAQRFSWVSKRQTTREEDMAYCLLGIFNINMPLLYGEGQRAFMRLQAEIIKQSDDESIFAWSSSEKLTGLLAQWPTAFAQSGGVVRAMHPIGPAQRRYALTNKGLEIQMPFLYSPLFDGFFSWLKDLASEHGETELSIPLLLDCMDERAESRRMVVYLISAGGLYYRKSSPRRHGKPGPQSWHISLFSALTTLHVAQPGWNVLHPAANLTASSLNPGTSTSRWRRPLSDYFLRPPSIRIALVAMLVIQLWTQLLLAGVRRLLVFNMINDFGLWVTCLLVWQIVRPSRYFAIGPGRFEIP